MSDIQLGVVEGKFADIIWENEPISSSEIVKLAEREFNWKKSTTYTVLKRLCEKGIFENKNGEVRALVSKNDFYSMRSESFIDEEFGGSLPAFLAAFTRRKSLSEEEVACLRRMIQEHEEV